MTRAHLHQPHHPNNDVPDEFEPGALPVEPDQGPVPAPIPDNPEHERDESTNATADAPDPVIAQAKRDIDAGLVDTDMHATAGLDARLRARLVPGAGGKPPPSGG